MLPVAVVDGETFVAEQPLIPLAGYDGTDVQAVKTDTDGNLAIVGTGVAGTPAGGVLTVQGDPGGVPIPVTSTPQTASTRVITRVAGAIVSTLLKAANAARISLIIVNDSNRILYLHLGAGPASATDYTYKLAPDDRLDPESFGGWDGAVFGIWTAGVTGAAQVTELTA
jgi:hypothetical protein